MTRFDGVHLLRSASSILLRFLRHPLTKENPNQSKEEIEEMEMQGLNKGYFADAGDGALANFQQELRQMKRSMKRCQAILVVLLAVVVIVLLALILVVAVQARRIRHLRQREGLIPYPNVTFASNSGDQQVNGLTYGGSLFRGSGFWSTKSPLPGKLTDHAAIGLNESVYIIGGFNQSGNVTDQLWRYDSIFHNYTQLSAMPGPRYRFGAALDPESEKIYVVGGRVDDLGPASVIDNIYIYDIKSEAWSIAPNKNLEGQSDNCAAFLDGKLYSIGGYSPDYAYLNVTQIYDPVTEVWTYGTPMPTARGDLMCAAFYGEVFAVGGYFDISPSDFNSFSDNVESLNPTTGEWTIQPRLLTPRGDGAVTVLPGDKLMVTGGEGHYDNNKLFMYPKHVNEVFYGADKTWVEKAMIPTARFRTALATAGGLAYMFGGADVCILDTASGICPALDSTEVYLDTDHPHVYIYLKNEAYNDNAALTTYPY